VETQFSLQMLSFEPGGQPKVQLKVERMKAMRWAADSHP
jgi:hypothetical protein